MTWLEHDQTPQTGVKSPLLLYAFDRDTNTTTSWHGKTLHYVTTLALIEVKGHSDKSPLRR